MTLLQSIREYYPDLTVIVADDSKEPLKINDNHVEYYTMPFGKVRPSQMGRQGVPGQESPRVSFYPGWGCPRGLPGSRVLEWEG